MRSRGRGEGVTGLQPVDHVVEGLVQELVGRLLGDDLQGLHDRDAGLDEDAELAREVHDVLAGHRLLRDLELEDALLLRHLRRLEAPLEQGQVGRAG